MLEHTFLTGLPTDPERRTAIAFSLETINNSITEAARIFSATWAYREMLLAQTALQRAKGEIADVIVQHFAPTRVVHEWNTGDREMPPIGFPLCPILHKSGVPAHLSNAWRMIDLSVHLMRAQWSAQELQNCAAVLCGALSLIATAQVGILDQIQDAEAVEAKQAKSATRHEDVHSLVPRLQGKDFNRLSTELDDASSLLTDASCAMTTGWTRKALDRCSAMVAGAQALIDSSRRKLEEADAAYVRALQDPPRDCAADQEHTEAQS